MKHGRIYNEFDTEELRELRELHTRLGVHDMDGTATYAELLAEEALSTLFAHIDAAELADRWAKQESTRRRAIEELAEEL
jgi:hypothetical protein